MPVRPRERIGFYDSGLWSMLLPIQKNLEIGHGLVNSVTKSELKAFELFILY